MGNKKLESNVSKNLMNNCNISKVSDEMTETEGMPPIKLNYTKSKSHSDICDKNNPNISDKIGNEELGLDDLENLG